MAYYRNARTRGMRGVYGNVNFPLPSNSLPAAAAVVKAAATNMVSNGMAGEYGPPPQRWPGAYSRRSMAVAHASPTAIAHASPRSALAGGYYGLGQAGGGSWADWFKNNPGTTVALGLGAVLLLGVAGRRRSRR